MADQVKEELQNLEQEQEQQEVDYISVINDLKKKRVPIEKYNDVVNQNKQLLDALANGGGQFAEEAAEEVKDIKELCKELNGAHTNLDYIKTALEIRKQMMLQHGAEADPFVSFNPENAPDAQAYQKASDVAEGLQAMVDEADGDPGAFNVLIQQNFRDTNQYRR